MPIGVYVKERSFTNHKISLKTNDIIYMFSDGYIDQFGGKNHEKYKAARFKELLKKMSDKPMVRQKEILFDTFEQWRSGIRQLDDVLVIGVKILDNYGNIDFF
jgi:serine phosphatase RsbU (regulator of sigma subunit)